MAFRSQKAIACAIGVTFAMAAHAEDLSIEVRHDHLRGFAAGSLTATEEGLSFREAGPKAKHQWTLAWQDIQQIRISPAKVRVLSYADVWWKLGADREYDLDAAPGSTFDPLYAALKTNSTSGWSRRSPTCPVENSGASPPNCARNSVGPKA